MQKPEILTNTYSTDLESKGFRLYKGWNEKLAHEIVEASLQPHVVESTPNDSIHRFRDIGSALLWHNQGRRSIYTLRGNELSGLIWYDLRYRPDLNADYTFAIRMYKEAVGKKLAHGFMKAAHLDFAEEKGSPAVWLETDEHNNAAVRLYNKFGYETVLNNNSRLTMVYKVD